MYINIREQSENIFVFTIFILALLVMMIPIFKRDSKFIDNQLNDKKKNVEQENNSKKIKK